MLRTGKEHLESIRDGRVVYIGSERVDDVTRHPAFRNAAQTVAALYDMKADPALARGDDLRGRRRPPLDLFLARPLARGSAAAHDRPSPHRRFHLWHVRPLAGSRFIVCHRHGDEGRRIKASMRASGQSSRLLSPYPRQRHLCGLCGGAAAGRAQPGILSSAEHSGADACGSCARTTTASSSPA